MIDPIYANLGIYEIGDNLLQADNLFYVPSEQNSYIRTLLTYVNQPYVGFSRLADSTHSYLSNVELVSKSIL
jgi:hypothetical protein